jgi:hypothetical protein
MLQERRIALHARPPGTLHWFGRPHLAARFGSRNAKRLHRRLPCIVFSLDPSETRCGTYALSHILFDLRSLHVFGFRGHQSTE